MNFVSIVPFLLTAKNVAIYMDMPCLWEAIELNWWLNI